MNRLLCMSALVLVCCGDDDSDVSIVEETGPTLEGRAVLPADTLAEGPISGTLLTPGVVNGITIPFQGQPVQGMSGVESGREPGEYLVLLDNGFGSKANSSDFLMRAYYIHPDFKTATGGTGDMEVREYIQFRDPDGVAGFPIVNEDTPERFLTGADFDPESIRRDADGDLWVGEEFGPWILHFDSSGVLQEAPFPLPDIMSPDNPFLDGAEATHPRSRGYEGMAISKDGRTLYALLEGATVADTDPARRLLNEFDTVAKSYTGAVWAYRTQDPAYVIGDMWMLDDDRLLVLERDGGSGLEALFRRVYLVDLNVEDADGFLEKTLVLDLASIPDPDLVSLPPVHDGDMGIGELFRVMCESVEAVYAIDAERLLIGCDNNLPNTGRHQTLADDNELIVVHIPGLGS